MHMAAQNGHYLVVKYLLDRGADCQMTNLEEKTPMQLLRKSFRQQGIKIDKLGKKQKINAKEMQEAQARFKSMKDTLDMLEDSEKQYGGQQHA